MFSLERTTTHEVGLLLEVDEPAQEYADATTAAREVLGLDVPGVLGVEVDPSFIPPEHRLKQGDRVVVLAISIAVVGADFVVIADHKNRPASRRVNLRDLFSKFRRGQFIDGGEQEVHRHLEFVSMFSVILFQFGDVAGPGLADEHRIVFIGHLSFAKKGHTKTT